MLCCLFAIVWSQIGLFSLPLSQFISFWCSSMQSNRNVPHNRKIMDLSFGLVPLLTLIHYCDVNIHLYNILRIWNMFVYHAKEFLPFDICELLQFDEILQVIYMLMSTLHNGFPRLVNMKSVETIPYLLLLLLHHTFFNPICHNKCGFDAEIVIVHCQHIRLRWLFIEAKYIHAHRTQNKWFYEFLSQIRSHKHRHRWRK